MILSAEPTLIADDPGCPLRGEGRRGDITIDRPEVHNTLREQTIHELIDAFNPYEGRRMARLLLRLAESIGGTRKPTIAKVRGWCVGGGNEVNLLCAFCLAAESARFAHTRLAPRQLAHALLGSAADNAVTRRACRSRRRRARR